MSHLKFDPIDGYWRGPVWLDQVWFGNEGMRKSDFDKEADMLKHKFVKNCEEITTPSVSIRKYYHPLTGEGLNAQHCSWSSALLILLLRE